MWKFYVYALVGVLIKCTHIYIYTHIWGGVILVQCMYSIYEGESNENLQMFNVCLSFANVVVQVSHMKTLKYLRFSCDSPSYIYILKLL